MNIWMITTGSSDVQLSTEKNWNDLYREIRNLQCNNHAFSPSRPIFADGNDPFQVPARVMGLVYGANLTDQSYEDLCFPIFDALSQELAKRSALPGKIIVILTDQSEIFNDYQRKKSKKCPYWQDTDTLKPIIEKYFQIQVPKAQLDFCYLKPKANGKGLDDWNSTLSLVQNTLSNFEVDSKDTIYISHQAGTPAISSAIQFMSLAKFGKQVKFLVNSEYEKGYTDIIASPKYLRAIQLQEAKALLGRYDYAGVESLLRPYWKNSGDEVEEKIRRLLKIAIQWNYANFEEFGNNLGEPAKERLKNWWWIGYEAAYLAVVRLEQGNTVEALFHSFRAVEGLILEWAINKYQHHTEETEKGWRLKISILKELPEYINHLSDKQRENFRHYGIGLFSNALFKLLQTARPEWKNHPYINVVWNDAQDERNSQFHRLLGLKKEEVFKAWGTKNQTEWQRWVIGCLNFVSDQRFPSLKDASLMSQVHEELREALKVYQP